MGSILTLCLGLCFFPGPPEQAEQAVQQLYEEYAYQRQLPGLPGQFQSREEARAEARARQDNRDPNRDPNREPDGDTDPRSDARPADGEAWDRDSFQQELWNREDERGLPRSRQDIQRRRRHRERDATHSGTGFGGLMEALLWTVLIVAVIMIAVALIGRRGQDRRTRRAHEIEAGEHGPDRADLAAPRSHAEKLADRGEYAAAIHALLLNTIEALAAHRGVAVPAAWTSREIQQTVDMPTAAAPAFGALVDAVEAGLFAGDEIDATRWEACHARFREFEQAYRGAPA